MSEHIDQFVHKLLGTGMMLSELAADLIDALPDDAYPGEKPGAVVLEMLCGTIAQRWGPWTRAMCACAQLIDLAGKRTLEHLRLASEMSRRMHGGDGERGTRLWLTHGSHRPQPDSRSYASAATGAPLSDGGGTLPPFRRSRRPSRAATRTCAACV